MRKIEAGPTEQVDDLSIFIQKAFRRRDLNDKEKALINKLELLAFVRKLRKSRFYF